MMTGQIRREDSRKKPWQEKELSRLKRHPRSHRQEPLPLATEQSQRPQKNEVVLADLYFFYDRKEAMSMEKRYLTSDLRSRS